MKSLIPILLCSLIFIASCKDKEDDSPDPYVSFASKIIGSWKLSSVTNNGTQATETYPGTIDPLLVTFNSESRIMSNGPCNGGGSNFYIVSESGSFLADNFTYTQLFCDALSSEWESRVEGSFDGAYNASISGNTLNIKSYDTYSMTFTRQ